MSLEIRNYQDSDRDAVIALWRECDLVRPWNDPERDIELCLATATGGLLVAIDAATLVGSVMYGFDGHRGWIYYLAVAPSKSRSGIGRALMSSAERAARALGAHKVQLMIRGENAAVRSFYESIGYEAEDRVIMARWLGK